ncbi:MAG TPA: DJ-1/PfpI family protein [Caulobacteraceae bacterium]
MTRQGTTRRGLLQSSAVLGPLAAATSFGIAQAAAANGGSAVSTAAAGVMPLEPPPSGRIAVAFPISKDAIVIDFAGPWEVFLNASMIGADGSMDMSMRRGFQLYTVAETSDPVETFGGMKVTPDYTFATAPPPRMIVIPAQGGDGEAMIDWIRKASAHTDLTMSICTGAFTLAKTGLLSGKSATTHHSAYAMLAMQYPDIHVRRGYRFVDEGAIASSGGLTCGIDLAFHVVERYFGRRRALLTASAMEYQGAGWLDASGADNAIYAEAARGPTCAVCGMAVAAGTPMTSRYRARTYYFCSANHKTLFDKDPEQALRLAA